MNIYLLFFLNFSGIENEAFDDYLNNFTIAKSSGNSSIFFYFSGIENEAFDECMNNFTIAKRSENSSIFFLFFRNRK